MATQGKDVHVLGTTEEALKSSKLFDQVVLTMPIGREWTFAHVDPLGLGNQIGAFVAARCLFPQKPIVGFHFLQLVSPHSLRIRGRRLDFMIRSQFAIDLVHMNRRRRLQPLVTPLTFVDLQSRVLYLSAEFPSHQRDVYESFAVRNRDGRISREVERVFRIPKTGSRAGDSRTLGVHFRMGDFALSGDDEISYRPNTRIPVEQHLDAVGRALCQTGCESLAVFTDGSLGHAMKIRLRDLARDRGGVVIHHSRWSSGKRTFSQMMKPRHFLVGNSTLSFWASVLGGSNVVQALADLPCPRAEHFPRIARLRKAET